MLSVLSFFENEIVFSMGVDVLPKKLILKHLQFIIEYLNLALCNAISCLKVYTKCSSGHTIFKLVCVIDILIEIVRPTIISILVLAIINRIIRISFRLKLLRPRSFKFIALYCTTKPLLKMYLFKIDSL